MLTDLNLNTILKKKKSISNKVELFKFQKQQIKEAQFGSGALCTVSGLIKTAVSVNFIYTHHTKCFKCNLQNIGIIKIWDMENMLQKNKENLLNYKFPSIGMKRMVHTGNNRADIQQ